MLLERLWVRREASPPAPDLAIVRDTEDMDLVKVFKTLRGEDVPQEISALFVPRSAVPI